MAGNISSVNLSKFKSDIDAYNSLADKLHTSITAVCNDMKKFKTCWTGNRINMVITSWNNNYQTIDDNVFYFGMRIKLILLEMLDQYTAMEKGQPKNSSYGYGWGGILKVELTDASNIKFNASQATAIVNDIKTNINNANSYLKQLVTQLDAIAKYSDSLKTLSTTYKTNAEKSQQILTKLGNTITSESEKALQDVKVTEQYNESDASRASTLK